jgi:hypothetical protein
MVRLPPIDTIGQNTPLRLSVAAALAFPDGSMTASGLRRESRRGKLIIERVAGKDYTTLAHIERMRELCRVEAKVRTYGSARDGATAPEGASGDQLGLFSTAGTMSPQDALRMKLQRRKSSSPSTSPKNTNPTVANATSKT